LHANSFLFVFQGVIIPQHQNATLLIKISHLAFIDGVSIPCEQRRFFLPSPKEEEEKLRERVKKLPLLAG